MSEEQPRIIGELWIDEGAPNVRVERDEDGNFLRAYVWPDPTAVEESEESQESQAWPEGWTQLGYTEEGALVFVGDMKTSTGDRCTGRVRGADSPERACCLWPGHSGAHI